MPAIAVLGASSVRRKFGNKCVRAISRDYTVYPVHPTETAVEGLTAYPNIAAVPAGRLDRVSVYLPPSVGLAVLSELAARGDVGEVWLNPGTESPEILALGRQLGLNLVRGCSILDVGVSPGDLPE